MGIVWINGKKVTDKDGVFDPHHVYESCWTVGIYDDWYNSWDSDDNNTKGHTIRIWKGRMKVRKFGFDRKIKRALQEYDDGVLSTHQVNRKLTERHIYSLYSSIKFKPPKHIVWAQSPLGANLIMNAAATSKWWNEMHDPLRNTLRKSLNHSFIRVRTTPKALHHWRPRFIAVGERNTQLWNSTQQAMNRIDLTLGCPNNTWAHIIKRRSPEMPALWEDFESNIVQMGISRKALLRKRMSLKRYSMIASEDWISLFFMRAIKDMGRGWPNFSRVLRAHEKLTSTGALVWLFQDLVFCSDRPSQITVERFQPGQPPLLHCSDGPVMSFRDDSHTYAWRGTNIPSNWTDSEWLTPTRIYHERNGATFRQMLRIYGLEKYIFNGVKELHSYGASPRRVGKDRWGELWEIPHDEVAIRAVVVENSTPNPDGTRKPYALAVPPGCETPEAGLLAVHGLPNSIRYRPAVES